MYFLKKNFIKLYIFKIRIIDFQENPKTLVQSPSPDRAGIGPASIGASYLFCSQHWAECGPELYRIQWQSSYSQVELKRWICLFLLLADKPLESYRNHLQQFCRNSFCRIYIIPVYLQHQFSLSAHFHFFPFITIKFRCLKCTYTKGQLTKLGNQI